MTEDDALALLEAFAFNVITDPACRCASYTMTPLMSGTVVHYLKSAAAVIKVIFGVSVSVLADGTTHLLPVFHDLISHVRKWQCPKKRREPYTTAMFDAVDSHVQSQCQHNPTWFLSRVAAVNDWVHLGCFTGSRGNEYCQTLTGRHDVSRVPDTEAAGEFAGQPLAFMECDFTFYDGMNSRMTRLLSSFMNRREPWVCRCGSAMTRAPSIFRYANFSVPAIRICVRLQLLSGSFCELAFCM